MDRLLLKLSPEKLVLLLLNTRHFRNRKLFQHNGGVISSYTMGGGSSRNNAPKQVKWEDDYDDDDANDNKNHRYRHGNLPTYPRGGLQKEPSRESTTSLGAKIQNHARQQEVRKQRTPRHIVILQKDPKTGQIKRVSPPSSPLSDRQREPTPEPQPMTPPPPPKEDKRRHMRLPKPAMSVDLWGDPNLDRALDSSGGENTNTVSIGNSTLSLTSGSYRTRQEYDKHLALKRKKRVKQTEQESVLDLQSSRQPGETVELYPRTLRKQTIADDDDEPQVHVLNASQSDDYHNHDVLSVGLTPYQRYPVPQRTTSQPFHAKAGAMEKERKTVEALNKPKKTIWSEARRKDVRTGDGGPVNTYQLLSHGLSPTSSHFNQNVATKFLPMKE